MLFQGMGAGGFWHCILLDMVKESSRIQTVMRNVVSVASARLVSQVLLVVTGIFLIRYLGLKRYSEYSTALLYMGMFSLLGKTGFDQVFLREGSRKPELASRYYGATLLVSTTLITIGLLTAVIISYFRYDSRIFILCLLLGPSQTFMWRGQSIWH
jgi:O-antigen/teichoic acid export membrane protein